MWNCKPKSTQTTLVMLVTPVFIVLDVNGRAGAIARWRDATLDRDRRSAASRCPTYDRRRLEPRIVHVGVGGFHRAHLALYTHELAEQGSDWGIRGIGLLPKDAAWPTRSAPRTICTR